MTSMEEREARNDLPDHPCSRTLLGRKPSPVLSQLSPCQVCPILHRETSGTCVAYIPSTWELQIGKNAALRIKPSVPSKWSCTYLIPPATVTSSPPTRGYKTPILSFLFPKEEDTKNLRPEALGHRGWTKNRDASRPIRGILLFRQGRSKCTLCSS